MTDNTFTAAAQHDADTVAAIRAKRDLAIKELNELCNGKLFRMSIPVQSTDSDQILGEPLWDISTLIDRLDTLERIANAARLVTRLYSRNVIGDTFFQAMDALRAAVAEIEIRGGE